MRGSLKRRGPSWKIVLDIGFEPGPDGLLRRKQKFITFRGTKKQAEDKLTELVRSSNRSEFVEPSKVTLGGWLTQWVTALADSPVTRPATLARYRAVVERMKASPLAAVPLQKALPSNIEAYYNELLKTLAPGTVRVHHAVIHRALRTAVNDRLVIRNVAHDVENRPKSAKDRGQHARLHCWTAEEARAFIAAADAAGPQAAAFYTLALDSGARLRELAGLRWTDLDLESGSVTIAQQLAPGAHETPTWGPTKSGGSREIIVTPETLARLKTQKQHQAEVKMKNRTRYQDFGLVFAKEHTHVRRGKDSLGQPLQVNNIGEREFARLIVAAGVRRIKFHGLRHTSATLALAHGEPARDVADRLGHSKTSMTLDVYAHATERKAPTTIRRVLFG